jgi:hypothetical protein
MTLASDVTYAARPAAPRDDASHDLNSHQEHFSMLAFDVHTLLTTGSFETLASCVEPS